MRNHVQGWLLLVTMVLLCMRSADASILSDLQVFNGHLQAQIILSFLDNPEYTVSQLDNSSVVLDIKQSGVIHGLPLQFSGHNLVKSIHSGSLKDAQSLRLIVYLTNKGTTKVVRKQNGSNYVVVFTITAVIPPQPFVVEKCVGGAVYNQSPSSESSHNSLKVQNDSITTASSSNRLIGPAPGARFTPTNDDKIIIAVDAGHGGQDPGAIGLDGTREKHITIAIARKLRTMLGADPMFKGVMTRADDYFISVMGRSEVARKQNANLLVSIHADAALNRSVTGASVWVLSNYRANSEMAHWLEEHEKQSELLGGAGNVLANNQANPYLSQAVLDLQFGHSQRVGYDVAVNVLNQLKSVGALHKHRPEHASLGVLRAPDIPSILVEAGFISNNTEEHLLASDSYQQKIAAAIYQGLRSYFTTHQR